MDPRLEPTLQIDPRDVEEYGTPPPNEHALAYAEEALRILDELNCSPVSIVPETDGGIEFAWVRDGRRGYLSFWNEPDLDDCESDCSVLLAADAGGPMPDWYVQRARLRESLEQVSDFILRGTAPLHQGGPLVFENPAVVESLLEALEGRQDV